MKKLLLIIILYVSVFSAKSQQSNAIRIETLLKTDTSYAGKKLIYPSGDSTETTVARVIVPPGASTGWHKHDHPLYGYILQGELSVERKGVVPFLMKTGNAYAEVTETWHNGTNKGSVDCILIIVFTGIKNQPLSVKQSGF